MDREALLKANEKLHRRRAKLRTTPIKTMDSVLALPASPSIPNYLPEADSSNQDQIEIPVQKIAGSRAKWDSLDTSVHNDLVQAKLLVQSWYKSAMGEGYSCLLAGNVGCGKSHIAEAILEAMTPFKALFIEETSFVKKLQSTYGSDESELYIFERCNEAELLIYDDLGAYQTNNLGWIENVYRMIFEQRLAHRKPVLFTTNLSFTEDDNGDFGLISDHIGRRNFDRLLRGIMTDQGPYYADLFNVPSYQSGLMSEYLRRGK